MTCSGFTSRNGDFGPTRQLLQSARCAVTPFLTSIYGVYSPEREPCRVNCELSEGKPKFWAHADSPSSENWPCPVVDGQHRAAAHSRKRGSLEPNERVPRKQHDLHRVHVSADSGLRGDLTKSSAAKRRRNTSLGPQPYSTSQ